MREREKQAKERVGPGILSYVHQADTSADEHKRAGLCGGVASYVHRHSIKISYIRWFKTDERNLKYQR
jgi:hypothetical protein